MQDDTRILVPASLTARGYHAEPRCGAGWQRKGIGVGRKGRNRMGGVEGEERNRKCEKSGLESERRCTGTPHIQESCKAQVNGGGVEIRNKIG
jgi:hypothetical protein